MGSQRVGHDWATSLSITITFYLTLLLEVSGQLFLFCCHASPNWTWFFLSSPRETQLYWVFATRISLFQMHFLTLSCQHQGKLKLREVCCSQSFAWKPGKETESISQTLLCQKRSISSNYGISSSHVWMWELNHKEGWMLKNWRFWTVVLEKTLESPLDCKKFKPVNPKGNQLWIFIGRAEAEAPVFWPPDSKSWLIRKDPHAGNNWRQEEKGMTEDKMVEWRNWLNGHEFKQAPGDGKGQRSLARCSAWGHRVGQEWVT